MANYSRCNPFGSDQIRFGAPCQAPLAKDWPQEQLESLEKVFPSILPNITAPDVFPVEQQCMGIMVSSGSILASSACRLAGNSVPSAPPIPLLLASSGILRASSHLHVTG